MSPFTQGPRAHARDGTVAYEMAADGYALDVLPERGARVVSLKHGNHGEWLADPGRSWPADRPSEWADGDVRGWDECLPNIAPGAHPEIDVTLADHGDVWNVAWDAEPAQAALTTRVRGGRLPYEFRRILSVTDHGVSASYRLENVGDSAYSIAWAMHLLLDSKPEHLTLDPEVPVRVDSVFEVDEAVVADGWVPWGRLSSRLPIGDVGWAAKVFTKPGAVSEVAVDDGRGTLTVGAHGSPRPFTFGLWLNAAGWPAQSPLAHIGVEPGFGDHDALADAVASGSALRAHPGARMSWEVSITAT